jgi:hypothetical protein
MFFFVKNINKEKEVLPKEINFIIIEILMNIYFNYLGFFIKIQYC